MSLELVQRPATKTYQQIKRRWRSSFTDPGSNALIAGHMAYYAARRHWFRLRKAKMWVNFNENVVGTAVLNGFLIRAYELKSSGTILEPGIRSRGPTDIYLSTQGITVTGGNTIATQMDQDSWPEEDAPVFRRDISGADAATLNGIGAFTECSVSNVNRQISTLVEVDEFYKQTTMTDTRSEYDSLEFFEESHDHAIS